MACKVAGEAACKSISCTSGIDDLIEGDGRGGEGAIGSDKEAAVFSFFDGDVAGAAVTEPARGAEKIGFAREETGLGVVEDEHIDAGKELEKAGSGDIDPEVHGVGYGEFWFLHLIENEVLQVGSDIS